MSLFASKQHAFTDRSNHEKVETFLLPKKIVMFIPQTQIALLLEKEDPVKEIRYI
jgi:hypothetical protein